MTPAGLSTEGAGSPEGPTSSELSTIYAHRGKISEMVSTKIGGPGSGGVFYWSKAAAISCPTSLAHAECCGIAARRAACAIGAAGCANQRDESFVLIAGDVLAGDDAQS